VWGRRTSGANFTPIAQSLMRSHHLVIEKVSHSL
jgi:hypothetical protein